MGKKPWLTLSRARLERAAAAWAWLQFDVTRRAGCSTSCPLQVPAEAPDCMPLLGLVLPGLPIGLPALSLVLPNLSLVLPGLTLRFTVLSLVLPI